MTSKDTATIGRDQTQKQLHWKPSLSPILSRGEGFNTQEEIEQKKQEHRTKHKNTPVFSPAPRSNTLLRSHERPLHMNFASIGY